MATKQGDNSNEPAPFLVKMYAMLEDEANSDYIYWTDEDTVCVRKPSELAQLVLPKYFKHNNFCSFVRQLNTYGFRKIEANPNNWEFRHEEDKFRKGQRHLLADIKRKSSKRNVDNTIIDDEQHHHSIHTPEPVQYSSKQKSQKKTDDDQRDLLVQQVAALQEQHSQTMKILLNLVDEIRDTKKKVKDMNKKYVEISSKLDTPSGPVVKTEKGTPLPQDTVEHVIAPRPEVSSLLPPLPGSAPPSMISNPPQQYIEISTPYVDYIPNSPGFNATIAETDKMLQLLDNQEIMIHNLLAQDSGPTTNPLDLWDGPVFQHSEEDTKNIENLADELKNLTSSII